MASAPRRAPAPIALLASLLLSGCALWPFAQDRQPASQLVVSERLEQAQGQVPYRIPQPAWLPFPGATPVVWRQPLSGGATEVQLDYASRDDNVSLTVIDRPGQVFLQPESRFDPVRLTLGRGQAATYMNNGRAGILQWREGGLSYLLMGSSGARPYEADELVKIADTVQ